MGSEVVGETTWAKNWILRRIDLRVLMYYYFPIFVRVSAKHSSLFNCIGYLLNGLEPTFCLLLA